jgi:DNA primase
MSNTASRGTISSEIIELVRESADIVAIIGKHVQFRRSGVELIGRCPFHADKTPSFAVHPGKAVFHCHGCGVGGDVFEFVRLLHNYSFHQALEFLATRAGVQLEGFQPSPELIAKVAALKSQREERLDFERFVNERIQAVNRQYRSLGRAATHAENCLCAGESDPFVQEMAWDALERFRLFEARVEREGLCDLDVLKTAWEELRRDAAA